MGLGLLLPVVVSILLALPAFAADARVTLYIDGGKIEKVVSAGRGSAEVILPASALPDSLRVQPANGVVIDRVEIVPIHTGSKRAQQIEKLAERREQLEDRLKALITREQIFTAAAKSQSAKAPRKTKNNPEPLTTIRQGTDFAIAQLEGVYLAKRKTEKELKQIEDKLESVKKAGNIGGSVARVWLKGKGGSVTVSYLVSDLRWAPLYDFRVDIAGSVTVSQQASIPSLGKGSVVTVVPGLMAEADKLQPVAVTFKPLPEVFKQTFPIVEMLQSTSPQSGISFAFTNTLATAFPSGTASCFAKGEYLGRFNFAGMAPGATTRITCGK